MLAEAFNTSADVATLIVILFAILGVAFFSNLEGQGVNLKDRQQAAAVATLALGIVVPVIVGLVLLIVTGWLWSTGIMNGTEIHHKLWGWLTEWHTEGSRKKGYEQVGELGRLPVVYVMSVLTLYIVYQVCELVAYPIRVFADLARQGIRVGTRKPKPKVEILDIQDPHQKWRN